MPSSSDIQQYLLGSWRMMNGKADGIRLLDITADGFWDSFLAILFALPALIAGWVATTNSVAPATVPLGTRLFVVLRLATAGIGVWIVPLVVFVLAARRAGLADKVAHYVISTNWGSVLISWMMLPPMLLAMMFPAADQVATTIWIGLFALSLVFEWRLTNSALGKGGAVATAVFVAMYVLSFVVLYLLELVLGLGSLEPAPG